MTNPDVRAGDKYSILEEATLRYRRMIMWKPEDSQAGSIPLVIDLITPFGGGEDLLKELKGKLFADVPVTVFARGKDGERFGLVRVES